MKYKNTHMHAETLVMAFTENHSHFIFYFYFLKFEENIVTK